MKPIVTWVLIANAKHAHIAVNTGPGRGFSCPRVLNWTAKPPVDYADRAGAARSSTRSGSVTFDARDPKDLAQANFARDVIDQLDGHLKRQEFDRLILTAAPNMLGSLRNMMTDQLQAAIIASVDKDLVHVPTRDLPEHLADVIAA